MNKSGLSPKARQVFEQMKEAEWRDLRNRLLYFGYRNYGGNDRRLGYHLDDAVEDAIVDVVTGVRQWPPVDEYGNEREIGLFVFLCQTVRSKISHVIAKKAREIQFEDVQGLDLPLDRLETLRGSKESELERKIIYSEFSEQLLKLVSDDNTLTKLIKVLIETPDLRPQEIAPLLGISMQEMRNAQKRLSRRLKALREEKYDKHSQ
jgi:DNA-directed RNA polymerase specialized sigma24 family protein